MERLTITKHILRMMMLAFFVFAKLEVRNIMRKILWRTTKVEETVISQSEMDRTLALCNLQTGEKRVVRKGAGDPFVLAARVSVICGLERNSISI
jgi:hypothetical protein